MAAKLIYGMLTSLDGYMAAADGTLVLPVPEADLHQYFNAQMRRAKTVLHGRRMYEVMRFWDTAGDEPGAPEVAVDFARAWKETPKIVFSKTLREVGPNARLVKDDLEGVVRAVKADPELFETAAKLLKNGGRLMLFRPAHSPSADPPGFVRTSTVPLIDSPQSFLSIYRRLFHVEQ